MPQLKKTEDRIQSECYIWFHNSFPDYRGLLCYNLNNSKNRIDGARNKALGLQAGRADMTFYWKGTAYFFELKTEIGTQQPVQKTWMLQMLSHGFEYHIIRDLETFQNIINQICTH
jgi:hypothetical protein